MTVLVLGLGFLVEAIINLRSISANSARPSSDGCSMGRFRWA